MSKLNVLPGMEAFADQVGKLNNLLGPGKPKGYAAEPGTGPIGETCKTCKHFTHKKHHRVYRKCLLMEKVWNNSYGTDIKACAPACRLFEKATPDGEGKR